MSNFFFVNLGRELYLQEGKSEVFSFDANMASVQKLVKWRRRTVGRIPKKCIETSNLMCLSLIWLILFYFVETYFVQWQTSESNV